MSLEKITEQNMHGHSALSFAFQNTRTPILNEFLRLHGENLKEHLITCFKRFPIPGSKYLREAVQQNNLTLLRMVLPDHEAFGVNLNQKDAQGNTLVILASQYGNLEALQLVMAALNSSKEISVSEPPKEPLKKVMAPRPNQKVAEPDPLDPPQNGNRVAKFPKKTSRNNPPVFRKYVEEEEL